jgi:hypothetical protein
MQFDDLAIDLDWLAHLVENERRKSTGIVRTFVVLHAMIGARNQRARPHPRRSVGDIG